MEANEDRSGALTGQSYPAEFAVRMGMSVADGEVLCKLLVRCPPDLVERVMDQLWLRSVFVEQRRRTTIAERPAFEERADRILALIDPGDDVGEARAALLQAAVDRAHGALTSSAYVGGPTEREAWQTALRSLGELATQHQGMGTDG